MRLRVAILLLAFSAFAAACMWDRDTLAEEAKGKMDVLLIIVGRFERNPPLYFHMRLERVAKEIAQDPSKLDLYDDAGVASDRLGKHSDAIIWMERKAAAMEKGTPSDDDRYRYHANLGTFYAHRWSDKKAGEAKPGDMDKGVDHLRKAIQINPNAHFGREKYQLAILEWVKGGPDPGVTKYRPGLSPLTAYLQSNGLFDKKHADEAIAGLSGLIRLGNAWESVDVFATLSDALGFKRSGALAEAGAARVNELIAAGKKPLVPWILEKGFYVLSHSEESVKKNTHSEFARLRKEADEWHQARTNFMNEKMAAGRHPDTDADFWKGFEEKPMEVRDLPFWKKPSFMPGRIYAPILLVVLGIPACLIAVKLMRKAKV